jgi:glycosyltransferase involved in cell wall biosynthesis
VKPFVSILIPAFNCERSIADTLRSALAQTWTNREIIVVDDGSTDRTREIIEQFEPQGVVLVRQKNQGAAAARNTALSLSRGDYIQWLDGDDLLAPEKIARQIDVIMSDRDPRTLLSGPWGKFFNRPSRAAFVPNELWSDLQPAEWLLRKMQHNLHMQTATWLVSRELCDAAGPWDTSLATDDDGEYFCRVLLACRRTRFVPTARVFYRASGPGSVSYIGLSNNKLDAQFRSMKLHIAYLRSLRDDRSVRRACVTYMQNWLPNFYPERTDILDAARALAAELGEPLAMPRFSWKYAWLGTLFGPATAKRTQIALLRLKWLMLNTWDKVLMGVEGKGELNGLSLEPATAPVRRVPFSIGTSASTASRGRAGEPDRAGRREPFRPAETDLPAPLPRRRRAHR